MVMMMMMMVYDGYTVFTIDTDICDALLADTISISVFGIIDVTNSPPSSYLRIIDVPHHPRVLLRTTY